MWYMAADGRPSGRRASPEGFNMDTLRKLQAFGPARILVLAGLLASVAGSGCQTATGTGAATGGALGAGIGALAGRCPGAALAGGLIGAGAGGLAGAAVDANREKKAERAAAADAALRAPSLEDIVKMTQAAVPPNQIIDQIRTSRVVYRLTSDQIVWLNQQGVHPSVVAEMQATAYRSPQRVVYTSAPPPVVVVEPGPPVVGVGFSYGYRR
jgi:hypothetical protein